MYIRILFSILIEIVLWVSWASYNYRKTKNFEVFRMTWSFTFYQCFSLYLVMTISNPN